MHVTWAAQTLTRPPVGAWFCRGAIASSPSAPSGGLEVLKRIFSLSDAWPLTCNDGPKVPITPVRGRGALCALSNPERKETKVMFRHNLHTRWAVVGVPYWQIRGNCFSEA